MGQRRVLLGPNEAAGVVATVSRALRRRGHSTELALFEPPPFGGGYDVVRGRLGRYAAAALAPARFDVLHLQGGQSFVAGLLDARLARRCGRLVLMHFWGSDCRQEPLMRRLHPARARTLELSPEVRAAALQAERLVPAAGRIAAGALVSDLELASYVAPHFDTVYVVPTPLELPLDPTPLEPLTVEGPTVLHAPSRRNIKGSAEIEVAMEQVAAEIPIRQRVLSGVPRGQLLSEVGRADVIVDQLNSETSGVFALEGMALGKPVLTEFDREKLAPFARSTPLVEVHPDTLVERLSEVCLDPVLRTELGRQGREFVSRVHDADAVTELLEAVYQDAADPPPGVFEVTQGGMRRLGSPR